MTVTKGLSEGDWNAIESSLEALHSKFPYLCNYETASADYLDIEGAVFMFNTRVGINRQIERGEVGGSVLYLSYNTADGTSKIKKSTIISI